MLVTVSVVFIIWPSKEFPFFVQLIKWDKFSRMGQVKFVEDYLLKIWRDMVCYGLLKTHHAPSKFLRLSYTNFIRSGPFLNTLSQTSILDGHLFWLIHFHFFFLVLLLEALQFNKFYMLIVKLPGVYYISRI